jgi:2-dehydro-3-deoxyphosphogluconate aldolase/(4S)-4-hydroxy-2-oxoglutarate aldolase
MTKEQCVQTLIESGVVAVIRVNSAAELVNISTALSKGGVKGIEITMTSPGAIEAIKEAATLLGDQAIIGAGTVLDPETGRLAILAGAKFVVGPVLNLNLAKLCRRYSVAYIPGAYTPTEILTAWEAGADIVKVFPTQGPAFIKDVLGPLPNVKLIPTGGIDLETLSDFIRAGVCCVGVGGALVDKRLVSEGKWDELAALAAKFVERVRAIRAQQ